MELSRDVGAALALLARPQSFNQAQFAAVVKVTADSLLTPVDAARGFDATACLAGVDRGLLKRVHAALATTLLEAAKQNYDEELLLSLLSEHGLGPKQSELVKDAYMARRDELRALLGRATFHFPHVVDVDWRLDYELKTSKVDKVDEPVWYITLKTVDDNGQPGSVLFTCNREEMQQLLAKVKDAFASASAK